jgi:hypothetical protein
MLECESLAQGRGKGEVGNRGRGNSGKLEKVKTFLALSLPLFPLSPVPLEWSYHFTVPSFVVSISACSAIGSDSPNRKPLMLSKRKFCASGLVRSNP